MADNQPIVMVIDDQVDFVEGVKLILEVEGYEVWTSFDGQQALDRLKGTKDTAYKKLPDLILADIMMPIMDGYALYEKTQSDPILQHIPFVFLTAKTAVSDLAHGKELGVEDYLTKPCSPDVLLTSVRGQLRHRETPGFQAEQPSDGNVTQFTSAGVGNGNMILIILAVIVVLVTLIAVFTTTSFGG